MSGEFDSKLFEKFLDLYGVRDVYMVNCLEDSKFFDDIPILENYCKGTISDSFTWFKSPEGSEFWIDISDSWETLYDIRFNNLGYGE